MKKPGKMVREVLHSLMSKSATTKYPFVKFEMPDRFRGKLNFHPEKCICCKLCMRDCPSGAINVRKLPDKSIECVIDLSRCIYCAQCVDSCPKAALESSREFELAGTDRAQMKVVFHGEPPPAAPAAQPAAKPDKPAEK